MAGHKKSSRAGGKPHRVMSISATDAQNNFGRVLDDAAADGVVYITKYDRPAAVVLSIREYNMLTAAADTELDELTQEFDEMLDRMQTSEAANGLEALFELGTTALGEAAVEGVRRNAARANSRRSGRRRSTQD